MKQYIYGLLLAFIPFNTHSIDIKNLVLDQKIGQLFMVAAVADEDIAKDFTHKKSYRMDKEYIAELIGQYQIGGIIYLGKSDCDKQKERTAYFQSLSVIPLLIGQDLEPGRVGISRLEIMDRLHNNKTLGEIDDEDVTYRTAVAIGTICKKVGVHINFAPVADVNNNPNNPVINDRAFGDNPEIVTKHAIIFAQGLKDTGIIACAKHFPGHGDTDVDSHHDLPKIAHNRERLDEIELYPFKELIKVEMPMIMVGHLEIPAFEPQEKLPSSLSKNIVTQLLRKDLGYKGLIITDSLHMYGVTKYFQPGEYELKALLAGNDILLCPFNVPAAVAAIKEAMSEGLITEQEIDEHVERIMQLKKLVGLC
jgi:beta-N-acetylhexosaminidase